MDENLKKRLLGATVLVALGVIFIPALLDNRGDDRLTVKMEIPDKPNMEVDKPLKALQLKKDSINTTQRPPAPTKSMDEDKPKDTSEPADSLVSTRPVIGNKVPSMQQEAKPKEKDQPSKTSAAKTNSERANQQWILQVGSFGRESNANGLVSRLRTANWKAYKETVDGATGKVYRVRLGPIDERELAENYRQQLVELGYSSTIIMRYP